MCMLMQNFDKQPYTSYSIDYYSFLEHAYQTRNKEKCNLKVETVHTNIGMQSISYSGSFNWNNLPINFRNITRRSRFCRLLKQELVQEYKNLSLLQI